MAVVSQSRLELLSKMEEKYEKNDTEYFVNLLDHDDYVIRTRATCILVDIGGEDKVQHIAKVLKNDSNELVRHEAAFSLGQMCYRSGIPHLEEATKNDSSVFVRHDRDWKLFLLDWCGCLHACALHHTLLAARPLA